MAKHVDHSHRSCCFSLSFINRTSYKHVHDAQFCECSLTYHWVRIGTSAIMLPKSRVRWHICSKIYIAFFGSFKCSVRTKQKGKMTSHVESSLPYSRNKMGMSSMRNCEALFKWKKRRASIS